MTSIYAESIKAAAPDHDPRHVEAYMRIEHGTLDALSPQTFAREITVASECVLLGGRDEAEALAVSFGL